MATKKRAVKAAIKGERKPAAKAKAAKATAKAKAVKAPASGKPTPRTKVKAKARRGAAARQSAMFKKVAFTMFTVSDPRRARAFYEGVLGLKRGLASPEGTWTEYDLPGGGCLALFCHPHPSARQAPGGSASIAFEVADLDALNRRLAKAGVVYQGDMVHGPHCRMSNILDSEGNGIILHQLAVS